MRQAERLRTTAVREDTVSEDGHRLTYTLFFRDALHKRCAPLYSIRAHIERENGQTESEELLDTFADPGHALIFYELCLTHRVLPVHLCEVREDFEG